MDTRKLHSDQVKTAAGNEAKGMDLRKPTQVIAEDLVEKADGSLMQRSVFTRMPNIEDFMYLQELASKNFICADMYEEAGDCKVHIAEAELKLGNKENAASFYIEAGDLYRLSNPDASLVLYETGYAIYCELGNFELAGAFAEVCADILHELSDHEGSAARYEYAADFHMAAERAVDWSRCLEHVALQRASEDSFVESRRLFRQLAEHAMRANMTQCNAATHLFHAGVVCLLMDAPKRARQYIKEHDEIDPLFPANPRRQFLEDLSYCLEDFDLDSFADKCYNANAAMHLTSWELTMLRQMREIVGRGKIDVIDVGDRVECKLEEWSTYYGGEVIGRQKGIHPRTGRDTYKYDVYFDDGETGHELAVNVIRREVIEEDEFELAMKEVEAAKAKEKALHGGT